MTEPQPAAEPTLTVLSGRPSPEELAVLVAVIRRRAEPAAGTGDATSGWADRTRGMRTALEPGPNRWQGSARPR